MILELNVMPGLNTEMNSIRNNLAEEKFRLSTMWADEATDMVLE